MTRIQSTLIEATGVICFALCLATIVKMNLLVRHGKLDAQNKKDIPLFGIFCVTLIQATFRFSVSTPHNMSII